MNSEEKSMRGCWWALLALIALSFVANIYFLSRPEPEPSVVIKRDTVWKDTTIYKPVPVDSHKTGEIVYIRIPYPVPQPGDTIHDSIDVPVPITQKRYEDSLYTAWVSGYRPALDSIRLYQPTITITETRTIVEEPMITFGIQGGAGYGITTHHHDIYIGVGGQINLWPLKLKKKHGKR